MNEEFDAEYVSVSRTDLCADPIKAPYLVQQMLKLKIMKIEHKIALTGEKEKLAKIYRSLTSQYT